VSTYDSEPNMTTAPGEQELLLTRYLSGALNDADAARFEAYWAAHPELTRDMEASARLKTGLADLHRRGELDNVVRGAWWSRPLLLLSVAAGIAVVGIGVVAWQVATREARIPLGGVVASLPPFGADTLPIGATYSVLRLRAAAAADATVLLPTKPRAIRIRILPEQASPAGRYRAELAAEGSAAGRPAGALEGLAQAEDGFVNVYVDSRALVPGRYRLTVVPVGSAERSVFVLDIRAPSEPQ
jgi:hypothetical protein